MNDDYECISEGYQLLLLLLSVVEFVVVVEIALCQTGVIVEKALFIQKLAAFQLL